MIKTFIAVAVTSALAAPAVAETVVSDGIVYTYTVSQTAKGTVIRGADSSGTPFELRVSGPRVEGRINGRAVAFRTRDVTTSRATVATLAAR